MERRAHTWGMFEVARARETSWTDLGFFVGATNENADGLGALEMLEGCGPSSEGIS